MAHFAKLDENNVVVEVVCLANEELLDDQGNENENKGIQFLTNWSGGYTKWVQTSYNANIRKNYAGISYTYDKTRDAFIAPKPFNSWILDEQTCRWNPPIPHPSNGIAYDWDEKTVSWKPQESYHIVENNGRVIKDLPVTTIKGSHD